MIAIIDYGVGNLFSLKSSFAMIGADAVVTGDAAKIRDAERLILPGVGAFGDAARKLRETGLFDVVKQEAGKGKPMMGICLGMQMLFEKSYEYGEHEGLALIPGEVVPMAPLLPAGLKTPHIGWNALRMTRPDHPLFCEVRDGECVYFVHSYFAAKCARNVIANTEYGINMTAAVAKDNVIGCQFHPEKSGETGLRLLRAFMKMKG